MSTKNEDQEPELSEEQAALFTGLRRLAVPIARVRHDATKELGLVEVVEGLYAEMQRKKPGGPEPVSEQEWEGLVRTWAELESKLDAWILEECKHVGLLAYGLSLPVTPSAVHTPVPSSFFHTHKLDVEKGTLIGERWSFTDLRACFPTLLNPRHRELVENGLWIFGVWLANEMMETTRQAGGRPPDKRKMVQTWLEELHAAKKLPETVEMAKAKALVHFREEIKSRKIHDKSVRRAVESFYSRKS